MLDHVVKDDSFAGYLMTTSKSGAMTDCDKWVECRVVVIPEVIHKTLGSGWIFPKRSALLPIFNYYVQTIKEGAVFSRIVESYYDRKGMPDQVCPEYDGKPIGLEKSLSLLGVMLVGVCLSFVLLM